MTPYRNLAGNSGVTAYEIGPDSITIEFGDGTRYLYTRVSVGSDHLERMKELATSGRGLSSFVARTVSRQYAEKYPKVRNGGRTRPSQEPRR